MSRRGLGLVIAVGALAGLVALTGLVAGGVAQAGHGLAKPVASGGPQVALETVAEGLTAPNAGMAAPGHPGRLFVVDQDGVFWNVDLASGAKSVFLDVSDRLVVPGGERGFLGAAFHPDYQTNGLVYTYTSEPVAGAADFSTMPAGADPHHQSVVAEWQVADPGDDDAVVDPASRRELLRIDQPQGNHNAGSLVFDADEMLLVSLGDGGAGDDQGVGHVDGGNGQDPTNVLGSILRLDPQGSDGVNGQYGIPADNPFVGDPSALDEVFAYGFRNPFRLSVDRATGDAYVGDVGQRDIEEVDVVVAGGNYGWPLKEGSFCFDQNGSDPGFAFDADPCPGVADDAELIDPVAEYNRASREHNEAGRAVIGGFVYRGEAIPALAGRYVFGDFTLFTDSGVPNDGSLFILAKKDLTRGGKTKTSRILEPTLADRDRVGHAVLGFGQDAAGEVYLLGNDTGGPAGDTGVVLRLASSR